MDCRRRYHSFVFLLDDLRSFVRSSVHSFLFIHAFIHSSIHSFIAFVGQHRVHSLIKDPVGMFVGVWHAVSAELQRGQEPGSSVLFMKISLKIHPITDIIM